MAITNSTMLELGTEAPDFSLLSPVDGKTHTLKESKSDTATMVMFICSFGVSTGIYALTV